MSVRSAIALVAAPLACLAVAGCGGGAATSSDAPAIPHHLGLQLVGRTSAVEASLSSGDQCAALQQASGLQRAEQDAIAAGRIPAELQAPLVDSTRALIDQIHCAPAPHPKPHHEEHHKKHGGEGD